MTDAERVVREKSDFLAYCDSSGRYADFHSNRHTFITTLERSGVSPRTAQSLARHSDIRLTMGVSTHIELHDQRTAIESLPAPPRGRGDGESRRQALLATGTDNATSGDLRVPTMVPRGAKKGTIHVAAKTKDSSSNCTVRSIRGATEKGKSTARTSQTRSNSGTMLHQSASPCTDADQTVKEARPAGFEPATVGFEVRYSIR